MSEIHETQVTLINEQGLHTRPAQLFVETAVKFESDIEVIFDDLTANGKSIMSLMGLLAFKGSVINIRAIGKDSKEAVESLKKLVESGFEQ